MKAKNELPLLRDKKGRFDDSKNLSKQAYEIAYAKKLAKELYGKHWMEAEFHPRDKVEITARQLVRLCSAVVKLGNAPKK